MPHTEPVKTLPIPKPEKIVRPPDGAKKPSLSSPRMPARAESTKKPGR